MAATYKAIAAVEVPVGGAATIDFQNIPQTYTDLVLLISSREETAATATLVLEMNGLTTNRNEIKLQGGASVTSSSTSDFQILTTPSNYAASTFGSTTFYIPNYTSNANKSMSSESTANDATGTGSLQRITAHKWANTSAITRITLKPNPGGSGGDINEYSSATLYGIKKD